MNIAVFKEMSLIFLVKMDGCILSWRLGFPVLGHAPAQLLIMV